MATHAVVDGSNIATEGRSEPSLVQLREAVDAFREEHDFDQVTVIVDASFEHRVAKSERRAARAAIDANEFITPPAGVIGRGDTFILQVADRADAVVVSNDSFQEFHGRFTWLFDSGRLIGGKPIPGIGWVYVPRAPVRGPVSRRATATADDAASERPDETPPTSKRRASTPTSGRSKTPSTSARTTPASRASTKRASRAAGANTVRAWRAHRKAHPVGSTVDATVEEFSSHGAYAIHGDVRIYLPLHLLGDPAPRRARDAVSIGETRAFVIHSHDAERNGIDAGLVALGGGELTATEPAKKRTAKKTTAKNAAKKTTAKKTTAKKAATKKTTAKKTTAKKTTAKKTTAKNAATGTRRR